MTESPRVVITAGDAGIGAAIAAGFVADGAKVHVCDVDDGALQRLTARLPSVGCTRVDVSDEEQVVSWLDQVLGAWGGLDVLVNNAGIAGLREQLAIVERWMDARAAAGEPFVVMGDFNRSLRPHDPTWSDLDDGTPPESDLTDPAATEATHCWNAGWVDFIDHIVFSRTAARWIVPGSFRQVQYLQEDRKHRARLSDHCPIVVSIE